jgi:hypothetical protein
VGSEEWHRHWHHTLHGNRRIHCHETCPLSSLHRMTDVSITESVLGGSRHSHFLEVTDAQPSANSLLGASDDGTFCGICSMRLAPPRSNGNVGALRDAALLAGGSVFAAKSMALRILVASWILADSALRSVLDADSTLDDTCAYKLMERYE